MPKLIIAEKPSVARAIKEVVGSAYEVTNCVGHLLELAQPHAYDAKWKSWAINHLPIRVKGWKLEPKAEMVGQLEKIRAALDRATEVVHAGDPDREGQLLVDEVLQHFGWKGPTKRVLINATDDATIKKAFARLEDNAKYQPLTRAAECRQRADWLVGMNLSRAVTKMLSDEATISIGRVQTPTLGLLVRRHREIAQFKSETFYVLRAVMDAGGATLEMRHEPDPRLLDAALARALAKAVQGQATALSVTVKPGVRRAPLPFDLATFQRTAENLFGWGANESLKNLQESYEAKLTSYPRTDCRYLPAEQSGDALRIAKAVSGDARLGVPSTQIALMRPSPRIYDSKKVAEHHGLIPTGVMPSPGAAQTLWLTWALVSLQFLASLLPDEQFDETVVKADVQAQNKTLTFSVRGEAIKNPGASWADLDMRTPFGKSQLEKQSTILPVLKDGTRATVKTCEAVAGKTRPPEPYTEAGLIADMRAVAKFVDDPALKAKLKETSGIGTAATQASIIETLKGRGFARVRGKALEPTELGIEVIDAIPPKLADPGITAAWEDALNLIAQGQYDPAEFMIRVDALVDRRIAETRRKMDAGARIRAAAPPRTSARAAPGRVGGRSGPSSVKKSGTKKSPARQTSARGRA